MTACSEQGVVQAIITNNVKGLSDRDGDGRRPIVPVELTSAVVDSSAVGMRKPDPAIHHHTPGRARRGADPAPAMAELLALVDRLS